MQGSGAAAEVQRLLEGGDLAQAREFLVSNVQREDSPWIRWLLFEVHALRGAWEAAQAQAAALAVMDSSRAEVYERYGRLAALMVHREAVWRGEQAPQSRDPGWLLWEQRSPFLRKLQAGELEALRDLRDLDRQAPAAGPGNFDEDPFSQCSDRDGRFAFGLEAFIEDAYCWLRWDEIARIQLAGTGLKPRDLVWLPVMLTLRKGGMQQAFLPARYPGSEAGSEPRLLLGREVVFQKAPGGEIGKGTHLLKCASGEAAREVPLTGFRVMDLSPEGSK